MCAQFAKQFSVTYFTINLAKWYCLVNMITWYGKAWKFQECHKILFNWQTMFWRNSLHRRGSQDSQEMCLCLFSQQNWKYHSLLFECSKSLEMPFMVLEEDRIFILSTLNLSPTLILLPKFALLSQLKIVIGSYLWKQVKNKWYSFMWWAN